MKCNSGDLSNPRASLYCSAHPRRDYTWKSEYGIRFSSSSTRAVRSQGRQSKVPPPKRAPHLRPPPLPSNDIPGDKWVPTLAKLNSKQRASQQHVHLDKSVQCTVVADPQTPRSFQIHRDRVTDHSDAPKEARTQRHAERFVIWKRLYDRLVAFVETLRFFLWLQRSRTPRTKNFDVAQAVQPGERTCQDTNLKHISQKAGGEALCRTKKIPEKSPPTRQHLPYLESTMSSTVPTNMLQEDTQTERNRHTDLGRDPKAPKAMGLQGTIDENSRKSATANSPIILEPVRSNTRKQRKRPGASVDDKRIVHDAQKILPGVQNPRHPATDQLHSTHNEDVDTNGARRQRAQENYLLEQAGVDVSSTLLGYPTPSPPYPSPSSPKAEPRAFDEWAKEDKREKEVEVKEAININHIRGIILSRDSPLRQEDEATLTLFKSYHSMLYKSSSDVIQLLFKAASDFAATPSVEISNTLRQFASTLYLSRLHVEECHKNARVRSLWRMRRQAIPNGTRDIYAFSYDKWKIRAPFLSCRSDTFVLRSFLYHFRTYVGRSRQESDHLRANLLALIGKSLLFTNKQFNLVVPFARELSYPSRRPNSQDPETHHEDWHVNMTLDSYMEPWEETKEQTGHLTRRLEDLFRKLEDDVGRKLCSKYSASMAAFRRSVNTLRVIKFAEIQNASLEELLGMEHVRTYFKLFESSRVAEVQGFTKPWSLKHAVRRYTNFHRTLMIVQTNHRLGRDGLSELGRDEVLAKRQTGIVGRLGNLGKRRNAAHNIFKHLWVTQQRQYLQKRERVELLRDRLIQQAFMASRVIGLSQKALEREVGDFDNMVMTLEDRNSLTERISRRSIDIYAHVDADCLLRFDNANFQDEIELAKYLESLADRLGVLNVRPSKTIEDWRNAKAIGETPKAKPKAARQRPPLVISPGWKGFEQTHARMAPQPSDFTDWTAYPCAISFATSEVNSPYTKASDQSNSAYESPDTGLVGSTSEGGSEGVGDAPSGESGISSSEYDSEEASSDESSSSGDDSESLEPLDYRIPVDVFETARAATAGSEASFWRHSLYRGPEGERIKVHYCTTLQTAESVCKSFVGESVVGFDLEWKSPGRPQFIKDNVSLIQIACEDRIALLHIALFKGTSKDDLFPPTLKKIVEDANVYKCGVAVLGDCTRLKTNFDVQSGGVFELSHLYKLVEYGNKSPSDVNKKLVSLARLVDEKLRLPMFKATDVRTSDWSAPLNYQQQQYAASDAYAGFQLYHALEKERMAMKPKPPRPHPADLGLPIRLPPGVTVTKKKAKTAKLPPEELSETESTDLPEALEDHSDVPSSDVVYPELRDTTALHIDQIRLTSPLTSHDPTSSVMDGRPGHSDGDSLDVDPARLPQHIIAYRKAEAWARAHLASQRPGVAGDPVREEPILVPRRSKNPTATLSSLRAYALWHVQKVPLDEVAVVLREPPLAVSTVSNYVLEAVRLEGLEADERRVREALNKLPSGLWMYGGRFHRLARWCGMAKWKI